MSNFKTMYPEGKKIIVGKEEFAIKPFVLRDRTKVLRVLSDAIIEYGKTNPDVKVQDLSNIEVRGNVISNLITVAGERLADIYEIALKKDKEWLLDNVQLADEVEIIQAIVEVNDLPFLFSQVKGLIKTIRNQKTA